jgi:REP element-mobilizing transposase RayT
MARPLRIEFADAVYHVTSRGNGRQKIFHDDEDCRKFLELFGKTLSRFNWTCHAFCLMGNHYHLMIETPDANLSQGMHHLNATVCQAHHKRYDTVGHLFQGRFKAIVVDRESYLLELARYVVLNPVRAGLVARPEDWPWSSYRATAGMPAAEGAEFVNRAWLLARFAPDETAARERYLDFVASGIGLDSPWPKLQSQLFLGEEAFVDKLKAAIPEKSSEKEIPRQQRYANRPNLMDIFGNSRSRTRRKRNEGIVASRITHGYQQKEIAAFLGIHYTTVSRVLSRHDAKMLKIKT